MRTLPKPTSDAKTVYLTCISLVRKVQHKKDLSSIASIVESDAKKYDENGLQKTWYLITESSDVKGIITQEEMEKVYTGRMAKKGAPGRSTYDALKAIPKHGVCPLCAHRSVEQLDHYLPKSKFSSLVVVPYNLVASCEKCNKIKDTVVPQNAETQFLHPYYDDVAAHQWLFAEVIQSTPPALKFYVKPVKDYSPELNARINFHFEKLELGTLYTPQAASLIAELEMRLNKLLEAGGATEVRKYLFEEADSRFSYYVNSCHTAMYQAMAESDWFCSGGFRQN